MLPGMLCRSEEIVAQQVADQDARYFGYANRFHSPLGAL